MFCTVFGVYMLGGGVLSVEKKYGKLLVLLFFVFSLCGGSVSAIDHKDSLKVRDTLILYKKIKKFAYKHRITTLLYQSIFVDPQQREYHANPSEPAPTHEEKMVNPYLKYNGRVIREINVIVKDPFGYSINDTVRQKINVFQRAGNYYHLTTRHRIIKNMLLFKQSEKVDALKISESERLIRNAGYINDARIQIIPLNKDTVDVLIVAQDRWEVTAPVMLTANVFDLRFRDKNIIGQGQQFDQHFNVVRSSGYYDVDGSYNVANLGHSFISSNIYYQVNSNLSQIRLALDRPFYSPLAKWAGGASGDKVWTFFDVNDSTERTGVKRFHLDNYNYDMWAAKNFKLNRGETMLDKSTNITLGWRYFGSSYERRPPAFIDTSKMFLNSSMWLGSVGLALQQYYKDSYIYRFGANEDVAEGVIVQWFYGLKQIEKDKSRLYTGFDIGRAKHFKHLGYLSLTFSYGIFFNQKVANNTTFLTKLYYFSNLHRRGKWFFRQFATCKYIDGKNKPSYETITLRSEELYGFSSGGLKGQTKMLLNLETVAYAPYNVLGFRFAPIVMAGYGMVGPDDDDVWHKRIYQGYSVGLLIRNENLLSSTFQITVGYYPLLPDGKRNVFTYNPVTSFTIRVRDFSVSKPNVISYD
jgi:hypothetical protein